MIIGGQIASIAELFDIVTVVDQLIGCVGIAQFVEIDFIVVALIPRGHRAGLGVTVIIKTAVIFQPGDTGITALRDGVGEVLAGEHVFYMHHAGFRARG